MEANEAPTKPFYKRPLTLSRPVILAVLAILVLSACILLFLMFYLMTQPRPLKPTRFTATPNEFYVDGQPELVTFTELNNNAAAYQNKFIRITGSYFPQKLPDCVPYSGPIFRSVLVSDDLQLDIFGGETALSIVPINTKLTVDGIWRKYDGAVGCGKEPPRQTLWYLEITNIVAPNPIVGATPFMPEGVIPEDVIPPLQTNTPTPGAGIPAPTSAVGVTPIPTATPQGSIPTPTTIVVMTVTPQATVTGTVVSLPTNTPTPGSIGTPTPTGTLTGTPTATTTGTPGTPFPSATPLPPLGTSTPGTPYPGPGGTPSPTPSPTTDSGY